MFKTVKAKVCGLTREEDVDLALSLGADYLGFIVYPSSPRGLSLERAAELASRVPVGKRVLVDVEAEAEALRRAKDAGFDFFQVHTRLEVSLASLAAWSGVVGKSSLWMAPRIAPEESFPEMILEFADTIVVDTYSKTQVGGTGATGDWGRFAEYKHRYPTNRMILAGGLGPDNLLEAIAASETDYVDVNSGVESSPGVKDATKMRALFDLLGR